jgi:predicted tellurium resistance membrane protein TerC
VAVATRAVTLASAIRQIAIADISMSVDNVLAIAGAANQNIPVLVIGLVVSVALMGVAATYIARLLQRYPALSYVGVALIVYVGGEMIWEGSEDLPAILRFFH